jgi:hypothetical protein
MKELIPRPTVSVNRETVVTALNRLMRQPSRERLLTAMRMVDEYAATLNTSRVYARADELVTRAFVDAALAKQDGYELVFCVQMQDVPEFFKFFGPDAGFKNFKNFYEGREARLPVGVAEVVRTPTVSTRTVGVQTVGTRTVSAQTDRTPDDVPSVVEPSAYEPVADEPSVGEPLAPEPSAPEPSVAERLTLPTAAPAAPAPPVSKTCRRCGQVLPLALFTRHKGRADGFESACQPCERARKNMQRAPAREGQGPS